MSAEWAPVTAALGPEASGAEAEDGAWAGWPVTRPPSQSSHCLSSDSELNQEPWHLGAVPGLLNPSRRHKASQSR